MAAEAISDHLTELTPEEAARLAAEAAQIQAEMTEHRAALWKRAAARADLIRDLHTAGWSYARIGKALGISAHSAYQAASRKHAADPRVCR